MHSNTRICAPHFVLIVCVVACLQWSACSQQSIFFVTASWEMSHGKFHPCDLDRKVDHSYMNLPSAKTRFGTCTNCCSARFVTVTMLLLCSPSQPCHHRGPGVGGLCRPGAGGVWSVLCEVREQPGAISNEGNRQGDQLKTRCEGWIHFGPCTVYGPEYWILNLVYNNNCLRLYQTCSLRCAAQLSLTWPSVANAPVAKGAPHPVHMH